MRATPVDHAAITERLRDVQSMEEALDAAGHRAVAEHLHAGRKIAVWKNGRVVWEAPSLDDFDDLARKLTMPSA